MADKEFEARKAEAEIELAHAQQKKAEAETRRFDQASQDWEESNRNAIAGLDRHRIFRFLDEVNSTSVENTIEMLDFWSRRDKGQDITIEFNSPGGSVIHGLALYDFIQELRRREHSVTTIARGMAASMGGVLLQAGDTRIMDENAHLLIHEISTIGYGKLQELEDEVKFSKRLQNERLVPILAERSSLSASQIRQRMSRKDWWLSSKEALSYGFVDLVQHFPPFKK
jgi:ATP-dependent Clp protease protease subunit